MSTTDRVHDLPDDVVKSLSPARRDVVVSSFGAFSDALPDEESRVRHLMDCSQRARTPQERRDRALEGLAVLADHIVRNLAVPLVPQFGVPAGCKITCHIEREENGGGYYYSATRADGTFLRHPCGNVRCFDKPEEAVAALNLDHGTSVFDLDQVS